MPAMPPHCDLCLLKRLQGGGGGTEKRVLFFPAVKKEAEKKFTAFSRERLKEQEREKEIKRQHDRSLFFAVISHVNDGPPLLSRRIKAEEPSRGFFLSVL